MCYKVFLFIFAFLLNQSGIKLVSFCLSTALPPRKLFQSCHNSSSAIYSYKVLGVNAFGSKCQIGDFENKFIFLWFKMSCLDLMKIFQAS